MVKEFGAWFLYSPSSLSWPSSIAIHGWLVLAFYACAKIIFAKINTQHSQPSQESVFMIYYDLLTCMYKWNRNLIQWQHPWTNTMVEHSWQGNQHIIRQIQEKKEIILSVPPDQCDPSRNVPRFFSFFSFSGKSSRSSLVIWPYISEAPPNWAFSASGLKWNQQSNYVNRNHRQFKSLVRFFTREASCVAFLRHVINAIMVRHLLTCHVI